MILIVHIVSALGSIGAASGVWLWPSRTLLRVSYGLVGATFATGFYLVFSQSVHLLSVCETGLVYLAVAGAAIAAARYKLARQED